MLHATVVLYTSCYGLCIEVRIFTIGVVVTHCNGLTLADALTDYSYVNSAMDGVRLARCLTGLGPSGDDNGVLGGLYTVGRINFEDKKFRGFRGYLLNLEIKYPRKFPA